MIVIDLCSMMSASMHCRLDRAFFGLAPQQDQQRNAEETEIAYTSESFQVGQEHRLLVDEPVQHTQRLLLRLNRARPRMDESLRNALQTLPHRRVIRRDM